VLLRQIYDPALAQYTYLIGCQRTGEALVVDPERDIERYLEAARAAGLEITAVAETHIHADFLSGARDLAEATGAVVFLSAEGGTDWSYRWPGASAPRVRLLEDGDGFQVGQVRLAALHTPGHTPEHLSFLVTDVGGGASEPMGLLSGDFLFVGDLGRPDLLESAAGQVGAMEPAARRLFATTRRLEGLADHLQVWPAHGAGSACGKALGAVPVSTLGYERRYNGALHLAASGEAAFVAGILEGQPEPPLYFGRMKVQNRDGAPPGKAPAPIPELSASALAERARSPETVVLDTRERRAFLDGHLRGSLWAPPGASFLAYAGSFVEPEQRIVLVAEPAAAADLGRQLYRVGLDRVEGVASPAVLVEATARDGSASIRRVGWEAVRAALADPGAVVLDVRRAAEHASRRVPGALNIAHTRLAVRAAELPSAKRLVVHCRTGSRAAAAAAWLARQGHDVVHVDAPFADWRD
jgi:hydroxyacylglutathione hydrolase